MLSGAFFGGWRQKLLKSSFRVWEGGKWGDFVLFVCVLVCYVRFWSGRVLGCFEGFLRRKMPFFHFFGTFCRKKLRFGHVKQGKKQDFGAYRQGFVQLVFFYLIDIQ